MRKVLLAIIVVVILAIIIAGGIFAWQYFTTEPNPTAGPALSKVEGWQTYTNTEYGFELKYPEDLSVENIIISSFVCDLNDCPYINRSGYIVVSPDEDDVRQGFVSKMEKITLNNQSFCFRTMIDPGMGSARAFHYYATSKGNKCFEISLATTSINCYVYDTDSELFHNCRINNENKESKINQIISTFKFIK